LQFQDDLGDQVAFAAIEECQRLTEWTTTTLNLQVNESDLSLAETLLDVGRQVSRWKYNWQQCRQDGKKREEVVARCFADTARVAQEWSKKILEQSGLLQAESR
jgi:hypothetical protein